MPGPASLLFIPALLSLTQLPAASSSLCSCSMTKGSELLATTALSLLRGSSCGPLDPLATPPPLGAGLGTGWRGEEWLWKLLDDNIINTVTQIQFLSYKLLPKVVTWDYCVEIVPERVCPLSGRGCWVMTMLGAGHWCQGPSSGHDVTTAGPALSHLSWERLLTRGRTLDSRGWSLSGVAGSL